MAAETETTQFLRIVLDGQDDLAEWLFKQLDALGVEVDEFSAALDIVAALMPSDSSAAGTVQLLEMIRKA